MPKFVIISDEARVIGFFGSESMAKARLAEMKVYSDEYRASAVYPVSGIRDEIKRLRKEPVRIGHR